jgi:hypothetical protein
MPSTGKPPLAASRAAWSSVQQSPRHQPDACGLRRRHLLTCGTHDDAAPLQAGNQRRGAVGDLRIAEGTADGATLQSRCHAAFVACPGMQLQRANDRFFRRLNSRAITG